MPEHRPDPGSSIQEPRDGQEPADGRKSRVEIEYCTQCRWLPRAAWLAQELLVTFESDLAEVALRPGTGGAFMVRLDGELMWDRKMDGFPEPTAIKRKIRDRVTPGRDLGHADR